MSNTGPSLQTQRWPWSVSVTQQRQAPTPQAIMFSRLTSQRMPRSAALRATAFIMGVGPQVYIML